MTIVAIALPECLSGPEPVQFLKSVFVKILHNPPCCLVQTHVHQRQRGIKMLNSNRYILKPGSEGLKLNYFYKSLKKLTS